MAIEQRAKYKEEFLSEAKEHLGAMNHALLRLEKAPGNLEYANDIFRVSHTLKSMAATMNYDQTARLCHAMEDVLGALRREKIKVDMCVDILFECFDTLDSTLKALAEEKDEIDTTTLVERLQGLQASGEEGMAGAEAAASSVTQEKEASDRRSSTIEKIQSIEVKVERLDLLMNLGEELLINKMRLDRVKGSLKNPELAAAVDTMGRVIADVQYNVMQARMVPIGFTFNRFPRMVRDLAKQQKKEVSLQTQGGDMELDRAIIDEISESLVHLLRNAVDHGIETPEERRKAGKPPQGTITLTAGRTKEFAMIEVTDDGAGLDLDEIKNIALKQGTLSKDATKEEAMNTIFSGVSTTKQVTAVSGRGLGLDIVKRKIESLGGTINAASDLNKGTTFVMEIPFTLAIIKVLFVEVGGRVYAIPLANIERLVTVNQGKIKGMLGYEAIVLNDEDIPLTRLNTLFGTPPLSLERQPIVIVSKGKEKLGLAVDALLGTEEIVIKSLNRLVRGNKYFAGSTIVGSGEVVLILDVANLTLSKRILSNGDETRVDAAHISASQGNGG